jgi:hypothetical protein
MLSEARASMLPFSFSARVDRIFPIQQFPGGAMRTVRLHISDRSGEATLVLWNDQAKIVEGNLFAGDSVECSGAYVRAGELAIGRNGSIVREGKMPSTSISGLKEGICNFSGRVEKVDAARMYLDRRTGEEKSMNSFSICNEGSCIRVVAWSLPEGARLPSQGENVVLENAAFRNGELHLNSFSRIISAGGSGASGRNGAFIRASIDGGNADLVVGTEKFSMTISEGLALFGVHTVPQGVDAATLLSIKSCALEGKDAHYFSDGGRLVSLRFEG